MKTIRKTIYTGSFPGLTVQVECVFDFKRGFRFLTILPNEGISNRNPFAVIFRVLKIKKRFRALQKDFDNSMKRLGKAFKACGQQAGNCAKSMAKLATAFEKEKCNG